MRSQDSLMLKASNELLGDAMLTPHLQLHHLSSCWYLEQLVPAQVQLWYSFEQGKNTRSII